MTETLPWASETELWSAITSGDPVAVAYAQEAPRLYTGQPQDRAVRARYRRDTQPPRREPAHVTQLRTERDQLAARVRELESKLDDAWEAAHAAWDAVADQPYRPARSHASRTASRRARLLTDPCSGARPLARAAG